MHKFLLLLALLALSTTPGLYAQVATTTPSPSQDQRTQPAQNVETVYIFGVAQSLADTILYVSDITELTGFTLGKNDFLLFRDQYAQQFRTFVEQQSGQPHVTAAVSFAKSPKKAQKQLQHLLKKQSKRRNVYRPLTIQRVSKREFVFQLAKIIP